jgi:hypothetical protein
MVFPGALALGEGTLVGFVVHMPTNPTSVAIRRASPRAPRGAALRRETGAATGAATAATPFASVMQ